MDHKRIGVMYTPLAMLMMPHRFNDAIIMRSQQAFGFREPNRAARETALSV
jgi:cytochrome o ubiquinol oxidase subunit I